LSNALHNAELLVDLNGVGEGVAPFIVELGDSLVERIVNRFGSTSNDPVESNEVRWLDASTHEVLDDPTEIDRTAVRVWAHLLKKPAPHPSIRYSSELLAIVQLLMSSTPSG